MRDGVLVSTVRVRGPLGEFALGFADALRARGYSSGSIEQQLGLISQLSRWLDAAGVGVDGLTELEAERFIAARRARGVRLFRTVAALEPMFSYLREIGATPGAAHVVPATAAEELLERYRRYLLIERGLARTSVELYLRMVRPFVERFQVDDGLALERVSAAQVSAFVLEEAQRRPGASILSVVTALRSLLRFLHVVGLIDRSLAGAVPGVGAWRGAGLPSPLESDQLDRLLAGFDRGTAAGRRDYAIVLLMARLGLRCGEVATMTLEDIDWRAGELLIYGKGRQDDRLPLPADVGGVSEEPCERDRKDWSCLHFLCLLVITLRHPAARLTTSSLVM